MAKPIANANLTLAHGSTSPISGGAFVILPVPAPSAFVKADGVGIYSKEIKYTFSGGSASGFASGSVATTTPQTITATAVKCKESGDPVMRLDDYNTMTAQGTLTGGGTGSVLGKVEISDAGQDYAKGD